MPVPAQVRRPLFRLLALAVLAGAPAPAAGQGMMMPGASGLDDPVYPMAGNGGYEVDRYDVDLAWDPETGVITGDTVVHMTVTQPLTAFNLDYSGPEISTVTVNGRRTTWTAEDDELSVQVPGSRGLRIGSTAVVRVRYEGMAPTMWHPWLGYVGWLATDAGAAGISVPDAARAWMPVNGHPSDKAHYSFSLTVPEPYVAVANGRPGEVERHGGRQRFTFETIAPLQPASAFVAFGRFDYYEATGPYGLPLRFWLDRTLPEHDEGDIELLGDVILTLGAFFGPFPFDETGSIVLGSDAHYRLEAQPRPLLTLSTSREESVVVHEVAHQWWGNSVTPATWGDIWVQEGLATYAELLWVEIRHGEEAADALLRQWIASERERPGAPPLSVDADTMFDRATFVRGALAAHALRLDLGDEVFFQVLQTFAERFRHDVASVGNFIAVAEEVAGHPVDGWRDAWLLAESMPDLP